MASLAFLRYLCQDGTSFFRAANVERGHRNQPERRSLGHIEARSDINKIRQHSLSPYLLLISFLACNVTWVPSL